MIDPTGTARAGRGALRIVVFGADTVLGRKVSGDLVSRRHAVVGVGHSRPESWPAAVAFVTTAQLGEVLGHILVRADAIALCGPGVIDTGALASACATGTVRIVGVASPEVDALRRSGVDVVTVVAATMLGREVDDALIRQFTRPLVIASRSSADRPLRVTHPDDVRRETVRALLGETGSARTIHVAGSGSTSLREIATAVGRRVLVLPERVSGGATDLFDGPSLPRGDDTAESGWTAAECVQDFALVCRGRVASITGVVTVPWRLPRVREIPAVDTPSADGVRPVAAGAPDTVGEFDTPIDPRFPAFAATNLSEALPGPFSPSSASVSVLGTRAAGRVVAQRLSPGGVVQAEMARRSTAVFGHRLYGGLTSGYFMAQTMPLVNPDTIVTGFFGTLAEDVAVLGSERPPIEHRGPSAGIRAAAIFAGNLVLLSSGARRETRDFVADVARFEDRSSQRTTISDGHLRALILQGRDHVVQGWVLASASLLVCTAYNVLLRTLCGRDVIPSAGLDVASANSLGAVHRLAAAAHADPELTHLLGEPEVDIARLAERAPAFVGLLDRELALIGHRGPGEVEMDGDTFADDPRLLIRAVAKSVGVTTRAHPAPPHPPVWARPLAAAAATQLRDREVRRDRLVRTIWVVRELLREYGRRHHAAGEFRDPGDVFYLTVDELDAPPPDIAATVARRRAQRRSLELLVPPPVFSGTWAPVRAVAALRQGESLRGMGVGRGCVRGRVRVVGGDTVNDVEPGEILVAKVTDIGYTPAFAYAAAVVTEVGGPISHAAIVAREYGVPCIVNVIGAADRLVTGTLIEVDGDAGLVTVLSH